MNISFESCLSSLFHMATNPERLKEDQLTIKDEDVFCISKKLATLLANYTNLDLRKTIHNKNIEGVIMRRKVIEFGHKHLAQVIVAACIHTKDKVLFLKLNSETNGVDGYHCGTITFPQGHCIVTSTDLENSIYHTNVTNLITTVESMPSEDFLSILTSNMIRELNEEIKIDDPAIFNYLCSKCPIHPIYINKPGSTEHHICMLFDIEISEDSVLYQYFTGEEIQSGEPIKHTVSIMSYQDLLNLGSLDYICTWVAASFSTLLFFEKTFVPKYGIT